LRPRHGIASSLQRFVKNGADKLFAAKSTEKTLRTRRAINFVLPVLFVVTKLS